MIKSLDEQVIMNCLQGQAVEEDMAALNEWVGASKENARSFFEMEAIHTQFLASAVPAGKVAGVLKRIISDEDNDDLTQSCEIRTLDTLPSTSGSRLSAILRYAAVLLLGVVLGGGLLYKIGVDKEPQEVLISKAVGATQQVLLADGTKVWLRDGATLRYPESFVDEEQRRVRLDGEAYFEVAKDADHPFVVEGDAVDVKVLGTKFNFQTVSVNHTNEVALIEGSVDVSNRETKESVLLSPGQKATLDNSTGKLVVNDANAILAAVWHDDFIPFENANIREIGDALEEIYNIDVCYGKDVDMKKTYSGMIRHKGSVDSVMHLLQNTIPVDFSLQGNRLTITAQ